VGDPALIPTIGRTELEAVAARIRGRLVGLSHASGAPHLGSSLSCVDILVALYWRVLRIDAAHPLDLSRDRFILSKGHAAPALYTTLAYRSFFDEALLDTFAAPGGRLAEQPSPQCVPGVEAATGSLGHGLPVALGMALAADITGRDYRVFSLLSDGECNEGSVWEAAMMAPARGLERVTAIVDFNGWQATGRSREVLALDPLAEKFSAFGWSTYTVDGHDLEALVALLARTPDGTGKPVAVIADTIKGKGVSFMEDDNNWHYRIPNAEEVVAAHRELGLATP
jgi:transketolase